MQHFSCELFFKSIIMKTTAKALSESDLTELFKEIRHDLSKCFDHLPKGDKVALRDAYRGGDFNAELSAVSEAFVTWRYLYEKLEDGKELNLPFFKYLIDSLYALATDYEMQ